MVQLRGISQATICRQPVQFIVCVRLFVFGAPVVAFCWTGKTSQRRSWEEMVNGRSGGPFVNDQNARLFLCLCTDTDESEEKWRTERLLVLFSKANTAATAAADHSVLFGLSTFSRLMNYLPQQLIEGDHQPISRWMETKEFHVQTAATWNVSHTHHVMGPSGEHSPAAPFWSVINLSNKFGRRKIWT